MSIVAYKAFEKTVNFIPTRGKILPYRSEQFTLSSPSRRVTINYVAPDGRITKIPSLENVMPLRYSLEIDLFGIIRLVSTAGERRILPNTAQHAIQKQQFRIIERSEKRKEEEAKERARSQLFKKPGEELHEVG